MKTRLASLAVTLMVFLTGFSTPAAEDPASIGPALAAKAINALGVDLLTKAAAPGASALLSPYSIQMALAMTYAGAAGTTRSEMARVLHYSGDETELHRSFAALQRALEAIAARTAQPAEQARKYGGPSDPVKLTVADRLFGQSGYQFRPQYLALLKDTYEAPFQPMDFSRNAAGAVQEINAWVDQQTQQRIRDLIPPGSLSAQTKLVLVNAIYLKAPWAAEFHLPDTKPRPFFRPAGPARDVPTMLRKADFGYVHQAGFTAVTLPYTGGEIQFLILLPDQTNGLPALEASLTADLLASCASPPAAELILYLPKFRLEPPLFALGTALRSLGLKSAFDSSANFDRMAPLQPPPNNLRIGEVFHKTFLALDEKGTEAAAATAVMMAPMAMRRPAAKPPPIEVRVDHPFLFAIQHRASGACLFLGRVTSPRF